MLATSHRLLTDKQEAIVIRKLRKDYPQGFNDAITSLGKSAINHSIR